MSKGSFCERRVKTPEKPSDLTRSAISGVKLSILPGKKAPHIPKRIRSSHSGDRAQDIMWGARSI